MPGAKPDRRQQILEVLAAELESRPGSRITTARLAAAVGFSEAALYRHFASKAQMFESLIGFAEDSVFALFSQVLREQSDPRVRCQHLSTALLRFAERNPGIARLLVGDVLVGEHARLRRRVAQFFARVETQLRQVLRESAFGAGGGDTAARAADIARLITNVVVGRLDQFVRDDFAGSPAEGWERQWPLLCEGLFRG